jgi:hypothetical protein
VRKLTQGCHKGVSRIPQGHYKVARILQRWYKGVTYLVCNEDLIGLRVHTLNGTHVIVIVTHLAEGATKFVTRVFQGCGKGVKGVLIVAHLEQSA